MRNPGIILARVLGVLGLVAAGLALADTPRLAPGFEGIDGNARVVVMPPDVELYELDAGGQLEPKADWTEQAGRNLREALEQRHAVMGVESHDLSEDEADSFGELSALHAAVAQSISLHHIFGGRMALPTKQGRLDWSLGDAVAPLRAKTQADYALFVWVRDSYATGGRMLAIFAGALFNVHLQAGQQRAYASLIDLHDGRVVWFNSLTRGRGDLREAAKAADSIQALLQGFPGLR